MHVACPDPVPDNTTEDDMRDELPKQFFVTIEEIVRFYFHVCYFDCASRTQLLTILILKLVAIFKI